MLSVEVPCERGGAAKQIASRSRPDEYLAAGPRPGGLPLCRWPMVPLSPPPLVFSEIEGHFLTRLAWGRLASIALGTLRDPPDGDGSLSGVIERRWRKKKVSFWAEMR